MNTSSMLLLATMLALQQAAASPAATSSLEAQLRQCRLQTDSLKRLNCYDALSLPSASWGTPAAAPSAVSAAVAAPAVAPNERFGLPAMPAPTPAPGVAQFIESQIEGRFLGWRPGDAIKLRNGQVWEIADDSAAAYELSEPKARIERGRFGGFFMQIEGVTQTPRVRRLR